MACMVNRYIRIPMAGTSLESGKFVLDIRSLSNRGLIIAPGQEAIGDIMDKRSTFYTVKVCRMHSLELH